MLQNFDKQYELPEKLKKKETAITKLLSWVNDDTVKD